jgi:hypothetical protein
MNVFARLNEIARIIRTDFDTWVDEERPSEAFLPLRWNSIALKILALPVPVRDEPEPVAGEINTERTKEEMPMTTPLDDMFGGFDDDLDPNAAKNDRPDLGRGAYVLKRYYPKNTKKKGDILVAELLVVKAPDGGQKKPGDMVSLAWFVNESDMVKRRYERARASGFVRALLGLPEKGPDGKPFNSGPHAMKLAHETQPGTGLLLIINAEPNGEYRNYRFENVPGQTPEKIKANRERITAVSTFTPTTAAPVEPPSVAAPPPSPAAPANPLAALFGGSDIPF